MIFFKFFDGEVGEREEFEERSGERKGVDGEDFWRILVNWRKSE